MRCEEIDGVAVPRKFGDIAIKTLKNEGLYAKDLRVLQLEDRIAIPVTDLRKASEKLDELGIPHTEIRICFPRTERPHGVTLRDLLREKIPREDLERIPRSFYIVGDIALISLDPDIAERYGSIIAETLMELHPRVRAVYARGETTGIERVRQLLFLGGEPHTRTIHMESGISIVVDIARAYYNPALATEHERIASKIPHGATVLDAFTGVGPFALHIAKRCHSYVIACDINAYALELLRESMKLNKLRGHIDPLNTDSFTLLETLHSIAKEFDYIILNLPHHAIEVTCSALRVTKRGGKIFLYTIAREPSEAISNLVNATTKCPDTNFQVLELRQVLDYAPRKYIYRITVERL